MINRVLIRIKAIQILYSFILVEKQFNLEGQPTAPTKEKRFAYSAYLDMLYLMVQISSRIVRRGGDSPLGDTRFIKKLRSDEKIKSLSKRFSNDSFIFSGIVDSLAEKVKGSAIYKNWIKKNEDNVVMPDSIWREIFKLLIVPDMQVNKVLSQKENYTLRGVDRMIAMMEETFDNFFASQDNVNEALNALGVSLDKARELYFRLLTLPIELTHLRHLELDSRRHRYIVNEEDLNPNLRFVENKLVEQLELNEDIRNFMEVEKLNWNSDDRPMLESLLKAIVESEDYKAYMELPESDFYTDCELWRNLFKHVIFSNPDFLEYMEDKSVFWNDDLEIIGTFLLKTFKRFADNVPRPVLEKYKDAEDSRFGSELIRYVLKNKETYRDYINSALDRGVWDSDRLAFMDVVIMETALAEILNFPKIPLSASINEYIEIAKSYSSAKSGQFINGLLGTILQKLREDGVLKGK